MLWGCGKWHAQRCEILCRRGKGHIGEVLGELLAKRVALGRVKKIVVEKDLIAQCEQVMGKVLEMVLDLWYEVTRAISNNNDVRSSLNKTNRINPVINTTILPMETP